MPARGTLRRELTTTVHCAPAAAQPGLHVLEGPQAGGGGAEGHLPRHHPVAAEAALVAFEAGSWGRKYAAIGQSWRRAWGEVIPFCAFPLEVRRLLYTTNSIEALNTKLRRAVRVRGHFPTDEAALTLLFLVLYRTETEWPMPPLREKMSLY